MKRLRIGVVGMGPRGRVGWLRTLKVIPQAKIVAVCDKYQALVDQALAELNDPDVKGHIDFEKMLRNEALDAVAVVVETENNPALVLRSLEAGKHTVCDVPLSFNLEDCGKIVSAVEKAGVKFCMAEQMSYSPMTLAWRKLVTEGRLGKIVYAEGQYLHGMGDDRLWLDGKTGRRITRAEARNNPHAVKSRVWNVHHPIWYLPHEFGPFLRILDDRVVTVSCFSTRRPSYHYEELPIPDIEVALFKTAKDTIIRQACGFCMPTAQPWHWYHLVGTRGEVETARTDAESNPLGKWWLADHYMTTRQPMTWSFTHTQPAVAEAGATSHGGLDYYPVRDFVDAVLQDRQPVVDVYRAADISAAGLCAGMSAEQNGKTVEVPQYRPAAPN